MPTGGRQTEKMVVDIGDWLPRGVAAGPDDDETGAAQPNTVLDWAEAYRRPDGRAFSLDRFTPLRALYEDQHPHICVIKPAQRGVSEFAINYACFALERGAEAWQTGKDGLNVAYLFPTQASLSDFSKERLTGMRSESSHLAEMFSGEGFAGVAFKQIGNSYLYLRGAWSESALLSFAADIVILDEYDRMDAKARALARRRMAASIVRREIDISTPTLPGLGIHALYLQSDRQVYRQPCPHCGDEVRYDFLRDLRVDGEDFDAWSQHPAEQIRRATVALHCPTCHQPVGDADRCVPGRWVAEEPEVKSLRGYQIPPLAFPMADLTRFAISAVSPDPSEQTEFWRSDMGTPHDASGMRVTPAMLAALSLDLPGGALPTGENWRDVTMGVDIGGRMHYRVSATGRNGERYILAMGDARGWDELSHLMRRYRVRRCVVDALPELHACAEWAAQFPGKIYRAFYPAGSALAGETQRADDKKYTVQINRTAALDRLYAIVAEGDEHWPAAYAKDPTIVAHMTAPIRVTVEAPDGQPRATWEHTAPDHWFHAASYDLAALSILKSAKRASSRPIFAQAAVKGWN